MDILRFIKDALRFDLEAAISMRRGFRAVRYKTRHGGSPDIRVAVEALWNDYSVEYIFVISSDPARHWQVKREQFSVSHKTDYPLQVQIEDGNISVAGRLSDQIMYRASAEDLTLKGLSYILPHAYRQIAGESAVIPPEIRAVRVLYMNLRNMRFFHIFPRDISEPQKLSTPHPLDEHGANLASVLRDMQKHPSSLNQLKEALRHLVPYISDISVTSTGGFLVTKLRHEDGTGTGRWFDLSQESDGTLRLLGLLTALYQQRAPSFLGIEEPEFAVHPGALIPLAELLEEASSLRSQILLTTHSPELIDQLPVDSLRVVNSIDGATTIEKVADHQVKAVKEDLFLPGELHRMEGLSQARQSGE
jgi:predicted ATPase